jgi:hypothetical protein
MTNNLKYRKFKFKIFVIAFVAISALTCLSFLAAFGRDEGTLGDGLIWNLLADSFDFFRLPTHRLLWDFMIKHSWLYFPALTLNVFFWSIVTERLITLIMVTIAKLRLVSNGR